MKIFNLLTLLAYFQLSHALMNVLEFESSGLLKKCYGKGVQDSRRTSLRNINGQVLPLPNSIETFVSIVERYESLNPTVPVRDLIAKLLKSFRIDNLDDFDDLDDPNTNEINLRDSSTSDHIRIKRGIFGVSEARYDFNDNDFTDDEKCALHFMLSHTVNDGKVDDRDVDNTNKVKHPRESGVVSLHSKRTHAFAVGRVLLGIYASYLPPSEEIGSLLSRITEKKSDSNIQPTNINLVSAVSIGDLITRMAAKEEIKILGNGEWSDISCPTEYRLDDNNGGFVTYSELRGAVDGLIIGKELQNILKSPGFSNIRLSQILRQYYGFSGLTDNKRTRWCTRERNFQDFSDFETEMFNFNRLYKLASGTGTFTKKSEDKIRTVISEVKNNIFKDIENDECSAPELSQDRKFVSPRNIFAILDYSTAASTKLNFQAEVIGNLSSDFDLRPRGNLMGVYTNLKPIQQNMLDTIVKNSGISGCPSCFAKYFARSGSKEDEAELLKDLNDTFTTFDTEQDELEERYQSETKSASPGKIVLYFNFGTPNIDNRVHDAIWTIRRYFGGATILAIGDSKENLAHFVRNDQTDIFPSSLKTIQDLKQRINKIPGEFTYKDCDRSTPSKEADNKQEVYIPPNKIQYWAMYPQYFLKSHGITLKFKPQDGASIKVCYTRSYSALVEGRIDYCQDSTGGEIEFYTSNPCYKRNVYNCDPFYFSVEGKKQPTTICQSLRCSTPNDIQFHFEHQGISCNIASYATISTLALLFAALMYHMQRQ